MQRKTSLFQINKLIIKKSKKLLFTVKGFPNLDSFPHEPSGSTTPISDMASFASDIPVIEPIHPKNT